MNRIMGLIASLALILAPSLAAQVPTRAVPTVRPSVEAQPQPQVQLQPQPTTATPTLSRVDDAPPPAKLVGTATGDAVVLVWSAAPGANGYIVRRSTAAAGPFDQLTPAAVADTQFTDTGAATGTTYFYLVTASRPDGHFGTSPPVEVLVPVE